MAVKRKGAFQTVQIAATWRWIEHRADEPLLRFAHYFKFEGG